MTTTDTSTARIVATFGRRFDLRLADGRQVRARTKGRRLQPVCGDRVAAVPLDKEPEWLIDRICRRTTELTRPDRSGRREILAANFDLVVVVAAALPSPDWFIVDRYLCAAELMGAGAVVLFNKSDLGETQEMVKALGEYADLGYQVLRTSARNPDGLAPLGPLLAGHTSIIVGQSGVGKSSLINALFGDDALPTGAVSGKRREGRHTTVNTVMRRLADGGDVIDSPGVRDYAPAVDAPVAVARGFREIGEASSHCRFANCAHLREPGCAVIAGVERGAISQRRYESYRRMFRLARKLGEQLLRRDR